MSSIKISSEPKSKIQTHKLWINGRWQESLSGKTFTSINPATEKDLAFVAEAQEEDIHKAVQSSRTAFDKGPWRRMKSKDRAKILRRMAELIHKNTDELALLETQDSGKPIKNSRTGDIPGSANAFDYYAGWADKLSGETLDLDPDYWSFTLREPLGVIGAITPWNFPLEIACQKASAALACGNTIVLKPAEQTPLTALRLAEISAEAGLPEGVLNVVPGMGTIAGAALVAHPDVDGISFTGEYSTGQAIMQNAAKTLKKISFELGGKSANIIFKDADLEKAAEFACDGIFYNQGEVCCSGSRLFVEKSIQEEFLARILDHSKSWQPGDPLKEKTKMGAIVSKEQLDKILSYITLGEKEGAKLILDGRLKSKTGYFIGPTIFKDVKQPMRLAQEEIFGPVLSQIAFSDFNEALTQANNTFYGLAAAVWTQDIDKALNAARSLRAGAVWVNGYGKFDHAMPFGGYKMSGIGREGGIRTFDFFTQIKSIWIRVNPHEMD